jgi:hypothetical protein
MVASHQDGSSLTGNKQAERLAVWWIQSRVPREASAKLDWYSVYTLLATEALQLMDQGPAPAPATNIPVSFQAFLADLEVLDPSAEASDSTSQVAPADSAEALPRNLQADLDAARFSSPASSPAEPGHREPSGAARLGASAKAKAPTLVEARPPAPVASAEHQQSSASATLPKITEHGQDRGRNPDRAGETDVSPKRARTASREGPPLFGNPPFGSHRLSLQELREKHPNADFRHVCTLLTEAAAHIGNAHGCFTEAAMMIHTLAMQNLSLARPGPKFRVPPPELQAEARLREITHIVQEAARGPAACAALRASLAGEGTAVSKAAAAAGLAPPENKDMQP